MLNASREALSNDVHHHTCTTQKRDPNNDFECPYVVDAFCRPDIVKDLVKAANKLATTKK